MKSAREKSLKSILFSKLCKRKQKCKNLHNRGMHKNKTRRCLMRKKLFFVRRGKAEKKTSSGEKFHSRIAPRREM